MKDPDFVPKPDRPLVGEEERRRAVIDLRVAGYSYQEIGDRLGITKSAAYKIFKRAADRGVAVARAQIGEEYFRLSLARLEHLMKAHFRDGTETDLEGRFVGNRQSSELVLRIHDRIAALLGINAPVKTEQKVEHSYTEDELFEEAARLGIEIPDDSLPEDAEFSITHEEDGDDH